MVGGKLAKAGAAGAVAAGGLLGADEAEAGRVFSTGVDAARKFARRVAGDGKAPNLISDKEALAKHNMTEKQALRRLESDLTKMRNSMKGKSPMQQESIDVKMQERIANHVHTFTDYDDWSGAMRDMEHGKRNGAGYLTGVDIMYEELRDRINPAHWETLDKYADFRLGPKEKNGELVHMGRRAANSKDDYFGYRLKDEDYYRKLWGEDGTFQHNATPEPKKSAAQVMAEADAENAARKAAEQDAVEIAAKPPSKVDRSGLKKGLFGVGGAGGAGGAGATTMNINDGLMPQESPYFGESQIESPSSVGFGPTAGEKVQMEYEDAHAGYRNQPQIAAPRSDTLQQITMGARGIQRDLEGSPGALLFPDGVVNYLEAVNRPNENPTWATRAWGLLDFL